MATLFIILFIFAMFHFIYESILSPMLRLEMRYKLFETRDKLINLKLIHDDKINDATFELLDEYACKTINMLPFYNLSNLFSASTAKLDKSTEEKIKLHEQLIKESELTELKFIDRDISRAGFYCLFINSGGWIYIVIPVFMIVGLFSLITHTYSNLKIKLIKNSYKMSYTSNTGSYIDTQMIYDI